MHHFRSLPLLLLALVACQPGTTNDNPDAAAELMLAWEVTAEADGEFDMPQNSLALVLSGAVDERIELGIYAGSFADNTEVPLDDEGAVTGGMFWWAGAGDEFMVTVDDGTLTVLHRGVDEMTRDGEFEVLETRTVPENVTVEVAE